jgi:glucose/arabinose dehydrogenase
MHPLVSPKHRKLSAAVALALAGMAAAPLSAWAQARSNPACVDQPAGEAVFYNPSNGEDIVVPRGYKVEVFAKDLNFPTAIAFVGNKERFSVLVLESGTGLPGACNNNDHPAFGGKFSRTNPFTPDIVIFDERGRRIAGPIGKPTAGGGGFQPDGPAIGLAFEHGFAGGTLFGTDSNQGVRGAPGGGNNSSRVVTVDLKANSVRTLIDRLPTGDHPTEQIIVKDGWIYWSQGSTTNNAVTGHDNAGGANQQEIPCEDIVLSQNGFNSGDGDISSGYSRHGEFRPGATVRAFESAGGVRRQGVCTGAILRARIHTHDPASTIEPFSWGYRNPFGIRFAPKDHVLKGCLFVTENGEDERGARPANNAPDRLHCATQNADGSPDYHGWPDRFGFLDSTQAMFNPQGGPADDLCPTFPVCNPLLFASPQTPVGHVLAFPPQPIVAPLALEPADVAAVGPDFVPNSFADGRVVRRGAALVSREGDFGFSPRNGTPILGHDVELVNFSKQGDAPKLELSRFAFNCRQSMQTHDPDGAAACRSSADADTGQAFAARLRGINRPVTVMFGPDGAAYLVDYGAVRDFGRSDPNQRFNNPADAPLAQIPGTGVIWKISRVDRGRDSDD